MLWVNISSSSRGLPATDAAVAPVDSKAVHIRMYALLTRVWAETVDFSQGIAVVFVL